MKKTNYFTLAALALLSLAGCTHDEEPAANGLPMTGTPLRATAEITAPVTREAMTTQDLTHYYFRVTDQDGAATTEYDYFTSMTLADGQWTGDKAMTWGTAYPKVSALEQKGVEWNQTEYTTGKTIAVQTDQSDRETGLLKSDLLYMAPKAISAADLDNEGNIKVNLAHRFAKLKVVVNVTGATTNPITALTIDGTQTTATFTPGTDVLTLSGNVADITPYRESTEASTSGPGYTATYECILLPQQLAANTLKVTAIMDEGNKSYTHAETLTLNSNYQYTLTLNMAYNGTMSPSGDVNVGNWGDEGEIGEGGELEEGAKIENGTYYVSTARGLLEWAKAVQSAGSSTSPSLTLTADIDMAGRSWPIIQSYTGGIIDGQGYAIKNLTLTPSDDDSAGLIAETASNCTIKNLTLWRPSITAEFIKSYGFFVGEEATNITMENCHVVSGSCNTMPVITPGGLVGIAVEGTYTACSVVSSNMGLFGGKSDPNITACYVFGSNALGSFNETYNNYIDRYCFNSYYQQSAGGSITGEGSSAEVSDWSGAAQNMNSSLGNKDYQWAVNTVTDDDPRPLVTAPKPTN